LREAGPRAAANQPGAPPRWEGWDDAAVAPEKLASYLRDLRRLLDEFQYQATYYGHFGHGCIHMQVSFDLQSEPGIRKYGEFVERAADLVVAYGGSISGEHGDGQSRGALPLSRRRRLAGEGVAALHRPRGLPQAGQRRDVPELHGDARGGAQHAR